MELVILPDLYAVCRLEADAPIPTWALHGDFHAITRTTNELSIVCTQAQVPDGLTLESDWRILMVDAVLDFSLVGILSSLSTTLADAGISIFALSTFDTDYLLVKADTLVQAVDALRAAGHTIAPKNEL